MMIISLILLIVPFETYGQMNCDWGKYGESCNKDCPENCMPDPNRKLIHCQKETGKCSEGCVPGWFEDLCDKACSKNCLRNTCNRQNGICTFGCDGTYTGDFCNTPPGTSATPPSEVTIPTASIPTASTPKETTSLAAIIVPVLLILVGLVAVVLLILFVRWRKRKRGEAFHLWILDVVRSRMPCLKTTDTSDRNTAGEVEPLRNGADTENLEMAEEGVAPIDASERDGDSTCSFEYLDNDDLLHGTLGQTIRDVQKVFVETESYKKAKQRLDTFGLVTITGGPGEGKTSMALMLGAEYRKQGYELVVAQDVDKVRLSHYRDDGKDVCVIFDDILKTLKSYRDLSGIKLFLYDLHVYLGQSESRSERRYRSQQEARDEPIKFNQPHICVIFAAETKNIRYAISELGGQNIFSESSYVQLHYTQEEKKELWLKYKRTNQSLDENQITAYRDANVGFPLVCKLFSSCADFQIHQETFFEKPLFYITNQLRTIISSLDDKSAALALIVLCGGKLNIGELETEGTGQGSQLKPVSPSSDSQLKPVSPSSDSQLKPVSPSSDGQLKPVSPSSDSQLKPVSPGPESQLKPVSPGADSQLKPVSPGPESQLKPVSPGPESHLKPVSPSADGQLKPKDESPDSQPYSEGVGPYNQRIPEANRSDSQVKSGGATQDCQLSPDSQQNSDVVSPDSQLKPEAVNSGSQLKPEFVNPDWQPKSESVSPDNQLQIDGEKPDLEAHLQAVTTLMRTSTRQGIAKAIRGFGGTFLTEAAVITFSHSLLYDVCASVLFSIDTEFALKHFSVNFLLEHLQNPQPNNIPVNPHQLTIPFSEANKPIIVDRMAASLMSGALQDYIWHPIWKHKTIAEIFSQIIKDEISEESKHSILCYACVTGNTDILDRLVQSCDINKRGLNGWTPVMYAVVSDQMKCFDILVKCKADISLCDDNNYNILHLACLHGQVSTVQHVKKELKDRTGDSYTNKFLNVQTRTGWTPVMCAVVFGIEGVSDCLVRPKKTSDAVRPRKIDYSLRDSNKNTLLHLACHRGCKTPVENLLPFIDINTLGNNGQTPIMCAVLSGRKETFDLLVPHKADIRLTDEDKNSPLHVACINHDVGMLVHMKKIFDLKIQGKHGWTPAMKAAVNGNKDAFEQLLDQRKASLSHNDDNGNNLLHLACHGGNVSIVKHLLPMFDINCRGNNGWTPLMLAAVNGVQSVFDMLVSVRADIRLRDDSNNSALHLACVGGNISIVKYLLQSTDINCLGNKGRTAIMVTALHARPRVFELLLSKKANIRLDDDNKDTLLHLACEGGNCSIVNYLIRKLDINVSGGQGRTPVMAAALAGMKDVFDMLSQGSDLTLTDDYQDNILHLACQGGNIGIVEQLVTHYEASWLGSKGPVYQHAPRVSQVKVVNEVAGAFDINIRGRHDQTPLMRAVCGGHLEVYSFLMSHNADHTLVDQDGQSLLHLASRHGQLQMIKYIIDSVDINSRDKDGVTPVMTSVICDKVAVFEYLREKGADMSLVDRSGNGVLHLANKTGNIHIKEHLEPVTQAKRKSGRKGLVPIISFSTKNQRPQTKKKK